MAKQAINIGMEKYSPGVANARIRSTLLEAISIDVWAYTRPRTWMQLLGGGMKRCKELLKLKDFFMESYQ